MRESSANEKKGASKGNSARNWKDVMIGGISGILVGASSVLSYHAIAGNHSTPSDLVTEPTDKEGPRVEIKDEIAVAKSVNDDMSFREAIEAARSEVGPGGAFSWHGQVFSTYRSTDPEWVEMGPAGQQAHCQAILSHVHAEPYDGEQIQFDEAETETVLMDEPEESEEGLVDEPSEELEDVPAEELVEEQAEESAEEFDEEYVEEPTVVELEEKPTIEQIIKLYQASEPVEKSENPDIQVVGIEENGEAEAIETETQPVENEEMNHVIEDPLGNVALDIFNAVRNMVNEEETGIVESGIEESGSADM